MLLAINNHDFDLLMGYQVQTDEAGHEFSLTDPRQQGYQDAAKRQSYAESLEKAYKIADSNLKEIIDAAKLCEDKYHRCVRSWDVSRSIPRAFQTASCDRPDCCR